ncbi:P-loop containing nucleoside triphosphate hydrolase protein [Polychaeton citri CBS 116435]|uniref:RNA helicase n=1 Tax=Polychaeton citri CBS 116435 TaxID=1314669 RepID=A0A9P4QDQ1_9PEZI|nr:P-loop containing nucleoside triphosphate hydrolase protein [Polychaeton citri CBS 116435]
MAGGKKKKTKPAANPARGFATTSIASKPKEPKESDNAISNGVSGTATPTPTAPKDDKNVHGEAKEDVLAHKELHELTPEQFEAQLEISELQQFVERYGSKVKRDISRQVTRLQTDRRIFRGQADYMSVKEWLPDELMQQVVDLIHQDQALQTVQVKGSSFNLDDDMLSKIWQLHTCLLDINIPAERVADAITHVLSIPLKDPTDGSSFGLHAALDWLALHCSQDELLDYDTQRQRISGPKIDEEHEDSDNKAAPASSTQYTVNGQIAAVSRARDEQLPNTKVAIDEDTDVSDVGSDVEPDELLSIYLRTRARLFEINPEAEPTSRKKAPRKPTKPEQTTKPVSKGEQKLQQKLQSIESDVLFDQRAADAHWASKKVDLAREQAERRKLHLHHNDNSAVGVEGIPDGAASPDGDVNDEAEALGRQLLMEAQEMEDDDVLGGMFDNLPGMETANSPATNGNGTGTSSSATIRDFGKITGLNPKRVLEEACKSRDPKVRLSYKLVSPTTYASRHSVTVEWSKDQELVEATWLSVVTVKCKPRNTVVTAMQVAAPDVSQSEAYAATAALFVLFAGSPKEEKAHLRLPPTYRNLWDEFGRLKRDHSDAADREVVKEVRSLLEDTKKSRESQPDEADDEDEVLFNASSRMRLNGVSGTSTPRSRQDISELSKPSNSQATIDAWNCKISSPYYQRMLQARMELPMYSFRAEALETISRHQVTILCGETGCGKSTQLPAFIVEDELSHGRQCKVYCTEPRRISAMSLAQRVSEEMGERKGDLGTSRSLVGYAIRLEAQTSAETRLIYATVGIVLRMLERNDGLRDITHLVIDEVHERSIDTDFLLIVLQSLMLRRPELKVVLMSATVDAQKFSNYLNGAPIITVPGRTYPVKAMYLEDAVELTGHTNEDATEGAVDDEDDAVDVEGQSKGASAEQLATYSKRTRNTLMSYHEYRIDYSLIVKLLEKVAKQEELQPFSKAVLVFLPGIAEIRQLNDMLVGHQIFGKGWRVHPLHSSFSSEDQQAAFEVPPNGIRKIVLATNIAETGITIPDVTCVIDTGKHKEMRFDERRQMSRLIQSFIARANAKQRRGRAGRVQEGICFHLFTRHRHDNLMVEQQTPEMLRLSLQDLVMRVKICKLGNIEQALSQALDPPSTKNIRRAIDALVDVDALTSNEELTPLGLQLAKLPLDAQLGKLILLSSIYGCLDFGLTTAAMLSSKSPFLNPLHARKQAETVRLGFKRGDSDLLTAYNAYSVWRKTCSMPGLSEYSFCNKNFLSPQNLGNIEDLKGQLLSALVDIGFVRLSGEERSALSRMRYNNRHRTFVQLPASLCRSDDNDLVATSVAGWAFYPKAIKREGKGWRNVANNQTVGLHPTSVNKAVILPPEIKYLSFYSIMQSSSRFTNAQETSPMTDFALTLLAGDAVFHMYAGAIIIDGNRLRFKVKDWKTMIVIKTLRAKMREVLAGLFKNPDRELSPKLKRWMEVFEALFMNGQLKV